MIKYDVPNQYPQPRVTVDGQGDDSRLDLHRGCLDVVHWLDDDGKVHARLNHGGERQEDMPPHAQRCSFTLTMVLETLLRLKYPAEAFKREATPEAKRKLQEDEGALAELTAEGGHSISDRIDDLVAAHNARGVMLTAEECGALRVAMHRSGAGALMPTPEESFDGKAYRLDGTRVALNGTKALGRYRDIVVFAAPEST